MKKLVIVIIVLLVALFLALRSERVQDFLDRLSKTHKVNLIQ